MLLGCIADDFTGATDLANSLTRQGMPCIQYNGLPEEETPAGASSGDESAAAVIALKSRSIPAAEAVAQSLDALAWLRARDCEKIFFKYCSTFDSTDEGNIGPVAEALLQALDSDFTIACPAAPENRRTVYQGHLFVGAQPLAESGMRNHPLNPMTDSNLVRVLGRQSRGQVGLIPFETVAQGAEAVAERVADLRGEDCRLAIADAVSEADLCVLAEGTAGLPLITGGSGLALGLPPLFRAQGRLAVAERAALPDLAPVSAVLAGSCSEATNLQVERMRATCPSRRIDPAKLAQGDAAIEETLDWAQGALGKLGNGGPILIYSTAAPGELAAVQASLGQERASALLERAMGRVAEGLVRQGVRRLVVAGGETSAAVVTALRIKRLAIGPEIDPGVPWTVSLDEPRIALSLKSGNFGGPDFFAKAFDVLP